MPREPQLEITGYGRQGVVAAIARITDTDWPILWEGLIHDTAASRERAAGADAIEEMRTFAFGFPTAVRLPDGELLATWWASHDGGPTGIRWARPDPTDISPCGSMMESTFGETGARLCGR